MNETASYIPYQPLLVAVLTVCSFMSAFFGTASQVTELAAVLSVFSLLMNVAIVDMEHQISLIHVETCSLKDYVDNSVCYDSLSRQLSVYNRQRLNELEERNFHKRAVCFAFKVVAELCIAAAATFLMLSISSVCSLFSAFIVGFVCLLIMWAPLILYGVV